MSFRSGPSLTRWIISITAAVGFLVPSASALAGPPKAFLHSGDERQRGHSTWFSQGRKAGDGMCSIMHADGFADWPPAMQHRSGKKLRIGFRRDDKPEVVRLKDYRAVTPNGSTVGNGRKVDFKLRPRRNGDEITGWKVIFKREALGDHYLSMFARWEGRHECEFVEAPYDFHIRTVPG